MNNLCFNCGFFMWKEENYIGMFEYFVVFLEGKMLLLIISDLFLIL